MNPELGISEIKVTLKNNNHVEYVDFWQEALKEIFYAYGDA